MVNDKLYNSLLNKKIKEKLLNFYIFIFLIVLHTFISVPSALGIKDVEGRKYVFLK